MISAFFIYNQKGEVLISRLYRHDLRRSVADIFRIQVISNTDVRSPIVTLGSTSFFHVRHENLYIVAVTKWNANAALIFEFCYRVVNIGRSYFGKFDEEAVKNNFVLIYELLDEILDFGYPQNSETDTLKMYITTEGVKSERAAEDSSRITIQATGAISWRRNDIKYRKNEAFIDVIESVNLLMSNTGTILRADVAGQILMRAYLSGTPECKFGLNDKLLLDKDAVQRTTARRANAVEIDDCQFHQCVKLGKFDNDRSISFVPPDGEFELMKYRTTENVNLPFKVHPVVTEIGNTRVEYNISVKANFSPKLYANNVVLKIPTPLNSAKVEVKVGSGGKAKYAPSENCIIWKIPRFQGQAEFNLSGEAVLTSMTHKRVWSRPPISMDFQVLMFTSSGLLVRFLKVFEKSGYQSVKWVRYMTKAGSYQIRMKDTDRVSTIDIEECVSSKRLYHSDQYHLVSNDEKIRIQKHLLEWYQAEKRTNMPWRKDNDETWDKETLGQRAYEVWVSEIMLQQTQVATVIDFYNRWMTAFPTIQDLANADIEKVNSLWAGLGYYSRAKRLWEGAQKVVNQLNGLLPNNAKELQSEIPGVGRYTAGAVASIVFGEATPVVDGNVIRVIARWRAIHADPKKAKTVELFWDIAASMVPESNPGDFNQAMMELGARICTPQNPDCVKCPISDDCKAFNQLKYVKKLSKNGFFDEKKKKRKMTDTEHDCSVCHELPDDLEEGAYAVTRYPLKIDKKPPRDEECAVTIVERIISKDTEPQYLISKRPETGLLAGLWEFPSLELESLDTDYKERLNKSTQFLKTKYQLELDQPTRHDLGNVVHLFSHIRKVYHIEWIQYQHNQDSMDIDEGQVKWVTLTELKASPIPTGLKKALKLLEKFKTTASTPLKKKVVVKKTVKSADISSFFTVKK